MHVRAVLVRAAALSLLSTSLLLGVAAPASAAPFTVTKTADTNDGVCNADCSLREAIGAANLAAGADTITVPAGTYQLTLPNAGNTNEDANATGDLDITGPVTITGAGAGSTIIQAGTNTTNGIDKVFAFNPICTTNFSAAMSGVTVRFGRNSQPAGAPDFSFTGGGIDWCATGTGSTFTLSNSVVSDNTNVNGYGGGLNIDTNGAVTNTTAVDITNVTFQNNRTLTPTNTGTGGAINIFGAVPTVTVTNSTFTGNSTANPTSGGGAIFFRPTTSGGLNVTGSAFSSNTAGGIGGAIATATYGSGTTVSIQNSSFTGNTATNSFGGAIDLDSTTVTTTPFALSHLTFTGNTAGISGGAVYVGQSNVTLSKSLIVGNHAPTGSGLHKSVDAATVTATNNWWGCSTGPGAAPCDTATTSGGTLTYTPWYRDQLTATTSPVAVNQSTSLTSSFLTSSAGSAVPLADLSEIIGRSVAWAATHGNLSSTQNSVQATGTATGSFQATSAGTAVISAKVDNDNTAPTSSNVLSVTVNKANTTAAITNGGSLTGTASVTGQPVAVNFGVTGAFGNTPTAPTGTVTVSDGANSCTVAVAAGTCNVTFTSAGSKTLTASYSGDANFNASASSTVAHTVNKADTTTSITSDVPDPSVTGQSVAVSYAVAVTSPGGGAPTGTVTVSDGTQSCTGTVAAGQCTIVFTSAGARSLTASYAGDSNFNASTSSTAPHAVNKAATTTLITSDSPDPSDSGQPVNVSYLVTATSPGSGTPTGTVTVSDGVDSCSAAVAAGTCAITLTTPGARTLTASYAGDSNFNASTSAGEPHGVTAIAVPDPPTGVAATAGNASASVSWVAPVNTGGGPITGYDVQYSSDGGSTWTSGSAAFHSSTATVQQVTGLTNGTAYAFRVAAINGGGTGSYSGPSTAVTPVRDGSALTIGPSTTVGYGSAVTLGTTLSDTTMSSPVAGASVSLYQRPDPSQPWSPVATVTTSPSGTASTSVSPTGQTLYQWRFAGNATHEAATSPTQTVSVAQVVLVHKARSRTKHGTTYQIYGTVGPGGVGQRVLLQRLAGTTWKQVASATLKKQKLPRGERAVGYVFKLKTATKKSVRYRVLVAATGTLAEGYSATVKVKAVPQ